MEAISQFPITIIPPYTIPAVMNLFGVMSHQFHGPTVVAIIGKIVIHIQILNFTTLYLGHLVETDLHFPQAICFTCLTQPRGMK